MTTHGVGILLNLCKNYNREDHKACQEWHLAEVVDATSHELLA